VLRPYQAAAVAAAQRHWAGRARRVVVALPTGAGKTVVAGAALTAAGARHAVAFVHTRTLLEQTRARLPGVHVMTVQAALRAGRPITPAPDVVFIDEVHHIASAAWSRLLCLLPPDVRIIGCTATPVRADGTALGRAGAGFDALVATAPYSHLLQHGWLAPCDVVRPPAGTDPVAAYLQHGRGAAAPYGWRPGVLFAPSIARCMAAVAALGRAGVRAAAITAATPARARRAAFAAFERRELDLLASPMALSEGFDAPRAQVCILDRPCVHHGVYIQTAGRILRPDPSKHAGASALLVDLHGASLRHGHPLADRTYHLEGEPIRLAQPARGAIRAPVAARGARLTPRPRPPAYQAGAAIGATIAAAARGLWAAWGRLWAPAA